MPASAARMPPIAVHTQRSDHQPEAQPSAGSMDDSAAVDEPEPESDFPALVAMPGTSGFASEPSTAADPPTSLESTLTSAATGRPRSEACSPVTVSRT